MLLSLSSGLATVNLPIVKGSSSEMESSASRGTSGSAGGVAIASIGGGDATTCFSGSTAWSACNVVGFGGDGWHCISCETTGLLPLVSDDCTCCQSAAKIALLRLVRPLSSSRVDLREMLNFFAIFPSTLLRLESLLEDGGREAGSRLSIEREVRRMNRSIRPPSFSLKGDEASSVSPPCPDALEVSEAFRRLLSFREPREDGALTSACKCTADVDWERGEGLRGLCLPVMLDMRDLG